MGRFQILCTTMNQLDFTKLQQMNIHSDVIFANQADRNEYRELQFEGNTARMITTSTKGVGKNRNIALLYADAEICLFADDDVKYSDDLEQKILKEFDRYQDADIILFNCSTSDAVRKQFEHTKNSKCHRFSRLPYPTFRIAFRLASIKKANLWFTTLFGGGCTFPSGEDSLFLLTAQRNKLKMYRSVENIGTVDFSKSTWFTGFDEKYYFGRGAFAKATHPHSALLWNLYIALRTKKNSTLSFAEQMHWCQCGRKSYAELLSYNEYKIKKSV